MAVSLALNNKDISGVELVIFDKDGTLIDVHSYWVGMVRLRAKLLTDRLRLSKSEKDRMLDAMGVDLDTMKIKKNGPVGLKKREIVLKAGVDSLIECGHSDYTVAFMEEFKKADEYSVNNFNDLVKPLPGALSIIKNIRNAGGRIAIATTDRNDRATLAMTHLGLEGFIDLVVGADQINKPKPDREIIDHICTRLKISTKKSVMVGDTVSDVRTGLNAECLASIGVGSGLTPSADLKSLTPYVARGVDAIKVCTDK